MTDDRTTVTYIGNFAPWWSTETHVARAFEENGCRVRRVPEEVVRARSDLERLADDRPDLVLYTATQGFGLYPGDPWGPCRDRNIPTASLHLDLYYGLRSPKGAAGVPRERCPAEHPMFRTDYVFTADGDHPSHFKRDGVNHYWLPPAVVADECYIGVPDPDRWPFDVAFVGSETYHPEYPERAQLVNHLYDRYGDRFAHVAPEGNVRGTTPGTDQVRGAELNRLYATIPVVVGDHCFANTPSGRPRYYWSDRAYEAPGRGGFQLYPYVSALVAELATHVPNQSYYAPGRFDLLGGLIDHWLGYFEDRPNYRRSACAQGSTWIKHFASYTQRAARILEVVGLRGATDGTRTMEE